MENYRIRIYGITLFFCINLFTAVSFAGIAVDERMPERCDTVPTDRKHVTDLSKEINEVVVTGTRQAMDMRYMPQTVSVVDRMQLEALHQPSVLPALNEYVPGLFVTSRGLMGYGVSSGAAGGMRLRGIGGSPTSALMVLVDGHPQYMGLMGHPIPDACQTMMAERVEVVRGPSSVLYGSNAMGGVVNIITRKAMQEGVKTELMAGYGSYNTFQTELSNQVRKGKFSSMVAAQYDRTDGHRADMEFEQMSGYIRLGYEFSTNWRLSGDANVVHFNASNPGTLTIPYIDNDQNITRTAVAVTLENNYARSSGAVSYFYNRGYHKINDGYRPGGQPQLTHFRSKDYMSGFSWYQNARLFKGNRLTVGFDYLHFGGKTWNKVVASGENRPGTEEYVEDYAGYIDCSQDICPWLTLNAGVRLDYHSRAGSEWIPQGGLAFRLPKRSELKVTVSKGYRNPTLKDMYMFPFPNPDLGPERMGNYEVAFVQQIRDTGLDYGVNLFYIDGDHFIVSDPSIRKTLNTGYIENWGTEANVGWRINGQWRLHANYSWLHMEHPVLAAPEHKVYAGVDFVSGRWGLTTGLQYVDGLYTSVSEGKEATENFLLWNMNVSCRLVRWASLFARGENLLAQRYEINAGYPMPKAVFMGGIKLNL